MFKSKFKKNFSLLVLMVFMLATVFSINAFAYSERIVGMCGESVTYSLDKSTGELIISGQGEMKDYCESIKEYAPWYEYNSYIRSIVIEEGVTTIGDQAFDRCGNLKLINIPEGVTKIGNRAFGFCYNLTNITIPSSTTSISERAFFLCDNLAAINVNEDNTVYESIDGILFSKDETILHICPIGNTATSYTIPDGVTKVGERAFEGCKNLTSLTIPGTVSSIESYAFYNCTGLTYLEIPNSVTKIGVCAFSGCKGLI